MNALKQHYEQRQTMDAQAATAIAAGRPSSPTESALERLQSEIAGLSVSIDMLTSRLKPVQTPPVPVAGGATSDPASCQSPLVAEIHRQADRIANLTAYVNGQTAQLEI